jgi:hypothetical protein
MPRTDVPPAWDERTILTAFLDHVRATVHAKCEHLAEVDARSAPLSTSPLTHTGLVNHLRWVEYYWFQVPAHQSSTGNDSRLTRSRARR